MSLDIALLQNQIEGLLNLDDEELDDDIKYGIHNLLGDILDIALKELDD